jgi:hypothetical protein
MGIAFFFVVVVVVVVVVEIAHEQWATVGTPIRGDVRRVVGDEAPVSHVGAVVLLLFARATLFHHRRSGGED